MKRDPIIKEVRIYREHHAKKFNYDLKKIIEDFKESELQRTSTHKKVAETVSPYSTKKH